MKLVERFNRIPRLALVPVVPIVAFLIAVGVGLGTSGDENDAPPPTPTTAAAIANTAVPTSTATQPPPATATPEVPPNRENCDEIRGTAYLSPEERQWYLSNCSGGDESAGGNRATGGGGGRSGSVYANEYAIGAQLIIPAANVNAVVTGADVGPDGIMPDPVGYFNAVLYNFPYHPGLGGKNKVIAAHVDCAGCVNGGPGLALFYYVRNLQPGQTAQYVNPDGSVSNYVVTASYAVSPNQDWSGIVAAGAADMTLITCTGTFSGGHYDTRHVVQLALTN